jgi:diaminohydroxyphosphoribosylaminopyrimidine deaminase/5-amino-6-(5-phosphoribosylamino)uracil reductase
LNIYCGRGVDIISNRIAWQERGVEFLEIDSEDGKVDLKRSLEDLGKKGVLQVLVEGGAILQSHLLKNDLVDRYISLLA